MIYFNQEFVSKARKAATDAKDLHDTANDLYKIKSAIDGINLPNGQQYARELNVEMRQKHPMISEMLRVANNMPRIPIATSASTVSVNANVETDERKALVQDYYGILCEVLLKKGLTASVEQFINRID